MSTRTSTSSSSRLERLWNERANGETNTSPSSVKPAMWNASSSASVAVLFRGQAWRWGCQTAPQRHLQSLCWQAYTRHLVAPLNADVYLPLDRAVGCDGHDDDYHEPFRGHLRLARRVEAAHQGDSFVHSLRLYRAARPEGHDMLYVVRHDVELLLPATTWRCSPDKLSFAAYVDPLRDGKRVAAPLPEERAPLCEEGVNDILHAVPRRYFSALLRMVGGCDGTTCNTWQEEPKLTWPSCNEVCGCFVDCSEADGKEETGDVTGHGCYSVLATLLPRKHIGFCWPPSGSAFDAPPTLGARPFYTGSRALAARYHIEQP